jgi:hypothetical protein
MTRRPKQITLVFELETEADEQAWSWFRYHDEMQVACGHVSGAIYPAMRGNFATDAEVRSHVLSLLYSASEVAR